jgi:hypothetical protein
MEIQPFFTQNHSFFSGNSESGVEKIGDRHFTLAPVSKYVESAFCPFSSKVP